VLQCLDSGERSDCSISAFFSCGFGESFMCVERARGTESVERKESLFSSASALGVAGCFFQEMMLRHR